MAPLPAACGMRVWTARSSRAVSSCLALYYYYYYCFHLPPMWRPRSRTSCREAEPVSSHAQPRTCQGTPPPPKAKYSVNNKKRAESREQRAHKEHNETTAYIRTYTHTYTHISSSSTTQQDDDDDDDDNKQQISPGNAFLVGSKFELAKERDDLVVEQLVNRQSTQRSI